MADVNHVVLVGRLTKDIEVKYSGAGFAIGHLSIAINRRRKNGDQWIDEAHFFDVTLLGKTAESLKPYLLKGKQIAVEGALQQDRWEKDGQKYSRVVIMASNVQLLGGNSGNSSNAGGNSSSSGSNYTSQGNGNFGASDGGQPFGGEDNFSEDIPF